MQCWFTDRHVKGPLSKSIVAADPDAEFALGVGRNHFPPGVIKDQRINVRRVDPDLSSKLGRLFAPRVFPVPHADHAVVPAEIGRRPPMRQTLRPPSLSAKIDR